jgi:D-psicose/D-tagatose/L-ribulose 3-epimerase
MKYGIYYAYWEKEWGGDALPYIEKAKRLGFDILEVACGDFLEHPMPYFEALRAESQKHGVQLTGGYGPRPEHNISSADPATARNAFDFYGKIFPKMEAAGIGSLGGAIYSYWPAGYGAEIDKAGDLERSVGNMGRLADMAADYGISLYMEALNRFEGYLLNEAAEAARYVAAVGKSNVKVMLDSFHMNIEEDSLPNAIRLAGSQLGELHVGEANRRPPRPGRMPWKEIGDALRDIGFAGPVVMEPFVSMGGQVGRDVRIWRDVSGGAGAQGMDRDAAESVAFLRQAFEAGLGEL